MNLITHAKKALSIYTSGYTETLNLERQTIILGGSSFVNRIIRTILSVYEEILCVFRMTSSELNIADKVICLVNSKNNYNSLQFLTSQDYVLLKVTNKGKALKHVPTYYLKRKLYYSILFLIQLPILALSKSNRKYIVLLHQAYGTQNLFSNFLKKNKPKAVVFANDHIPEMRSYLLACKQLGIKTIYLQHGAVSKYFPPLLFDLSLLDGIRSKTIYETISDVAGQIKLIGIPKLDKDINNVRKRISIRTIGIAVNQNDDLKIVEEIITALKEKYEVVIRMHPSDTRRLEIDDMINGNEMSLGKFINMSDFLVASDSSIHVESNSLECRSVYYMMHKNRLKRDYYGFVENKFIDSVDTSSDLLNYIDNFKYSLFSFTIERINQYNSAIGSSYYGKSSDRALQLIQEFVTND